MKREASAKSKKWLWLVIGVAVLLIAGGLTAWFLMGPSGDSDATEPTETVIATQEATQPAENAVSSDLYWNVDRAIYTVDGQISTRTPGEDGAYKIRFALRGELVELPVADKKLVNYIDTMDALGLVFDENGVVVDAVGPKDIAKEMAKNAYVKTVSGNTILANTSVAMNGMNIKLKIEGEAEIYDVTPEAEVPGQVMNIGALKPMDSLTAYGDKDGNLTHVFVTSHARESKVYWRADQFYDSSSKSTTREPDENGVYTVPFFCEGETVELKFKDKALVTKIDSISRWKCHFGFTFDEEGYVVEQFVSSLGIAGLIKADCWDIVDIQGDEYTIQRLTTNDGSMWTGTIPAGTAIYEAGVKAKQEGEGGRKIDSLQMGDRVTVWTDTNDNVVLVYVAERLVDSPAYYIPTRKYSSANKETTREIGPSGYYEIELVKEGTTGKRTYYVKDKATMSYIDSQTSKIVGLKVESGNVIKYAYNAETLTGYTTATRGGVVSKVTGNIITKITYGKRDTETNLVLAAGARVYNVSAYGTMGAETTVRPGDHIYAQRQPTGELLIVYVTKRTVGGDKLYWNYELMWDKTNLTSTRVPDADGWYYFDMAHKGKHVVLKTQDKELVDKIDKLSIGATGLDVNGDVITNVFDAGYPYGGNKVASGYKFQYKNSDGTYHCVYASDSKKTVDIKLASDVQIYNVSPIFDTIKGEKINSIPKGAMLTCFCDIYGEVKVVYVRTQRAKDMYWKTEILYDSTNKVTKRTPDADGYYWYDLAVNGELKTFKTKDQKVANSMDSYAGAFGLNVRGDEIFGFVSTSSVDGVSGNGFTTATVLAVNGKKITVEASGKTEVITLTSDCKIYDVSPTAEKFGAVAKIQVGDTLRTYLNEDKSAHSYVYIKARPARVYGETGWCEVCQKEVTWKPMSNSSAISAGDGHWYVPANMTQWVQSTFASTAKDYTICLDLNGKVLTRAENGRNFRVAEGETMNIMDSVGGGKIVTHGGTGYNGGMFMISSGGTVNMYGGTLEYVDTGIHNGQGGNIYMSGASTTFNLYDGVITGGVTTAHTKDKLACGGNFYLVSGATLNMYGGEISNGIARGILLATAGADGKVTQTALASYGGNIYMSESSNVNIYGGVVKDGKAVRETFTYVENGVEKTVSNMSYGGNIYKVNTQKLNGCLYIENATISGGEAHRGGNINAYAGAGATPKIDDPNYDPEGPNQGGIVILKNATITGGRASQFGGNIMSNCATWAVENSKITDGVITGTTGNGGNIYSQGGIYNVTGSVISGGRAPSSGGNINLYKNKYDANVFVIDEGTVIENGEATTGGNINVEDKNYVKLADGKVVAPADDDGTGVAMLPTLGILGGEIKGGQATTGEDIYTAGHTYMEGGVVAGNIYFEGKKEAELEVAGGEVGGEFMVKNPLEFTLSGAPVIANLTFDKNVKATVGELTEGADIKVTTNYASPVFTNAFDNAQAYVDAGYISGAEEGSSVTVTADNELSLVAAPPETKLIYCEHCKQEVEFLEWTFESGSYTRESGHFYLDKDESISANHRIGNSSKDTAADGVDVVIDLNGHNITSSGPVFYVYPYSTLSIQDSVGTSVVTGVGTLRNSAPADGGVFYVEGKNANLNINAGTYTLADTDKVRNGGVIFGGGTIKIFGGTFNGNTVSGVGSAFNCSGNLQINGGTINGEVYSKGTTTLNGAPVIELLQIPEGVLVTLGELTDGADITVIAEGVFTKPNTNAGAYVEANYIKSGTATPITVTALDELAIGEVVIEGLLEYACPHCNGAIAQWIPYDANKAATDNSGVLSGNNAHYYIPDGGYNQTYGQVSIQGNVTLDLHGQTLTGKDGKRLWRIEGTFNIVDTIGGGKAVADGLAGGGGALAMTRKNPDNGELAVINMYSGTLTMTDDCQTGSSGGILSLAGGTVMNMYGGEIYGGKATREHAQNIYINDGTLNMQGGFIDGGIELTASGNVNLSGTAKISSNNGGLWIAKDQPIGLDAMQTGAEIFVSVDETAVITDTLTNANDYLAYIKPAEAGWNLVVSGNALLLTNGEAPFDPNAVYEQAKAMDFTGADADGKVIAVCPVCREEVEWNILPANPSTSSLTTVESGHYYLSENVDYTQNNGLYSFIKKQVCINLNGQNMVSTVRAFYTENSSSVLNVMGDGSVSGVGYMGTGSNLGKGYGTFDLTSNANFYGGTYISTGEGPAIGNRKTSAGDAIIGIYAGTTVVNENGYAMYVMGNGNINICGGTINGAIFDNASKGISVSGAPVINKLDLTNGELITVGALTEGANITVLADGVFTEAFENAKAYLDAGYFATGVQDSKIAVEGNALSVMKQGAIPANEVYEAAKAMDFSAGGTVTANCPVCGGEREWLPLTPADADNIVNPTALAVNKRFDILPKGEHHHFYLDANTDYTKNVGYYNLAGNTQVCLNLNGQTLESSARVFYTETDGTALNIMGEGVVRGTGAGAVNRGMMDMTRELNLYGGIYEGMDNVSPVIAARGSSALCVVNIYEGTVIRKAEGVSGLCIYVMDNGDVNVYGGEITDGDTSADDAAFGGNIWINPNTTNKAYTAALNIYGGTISGGKDAKGGNIYVTGNDGANPSAAVNISGGKVIGGGVYATGANATVTVSGDAVVEYIDVIDGNLLTVGEMTEGASVKVSAGLGVPFTTTIGAKAADYAQYFYGAGDHTKAIVKDDALVLEDVCPHCNVPLSEITWTEIVHDGAKYVFPASGHYKMTSDLESSGNTFTFNDATATTGLDVVVDTCGFNITSKGRVAYVAKYNKFTIFDSVGGTVATSISTNNALGGSGMTVYSGAEANIYDITINGSAGANGKGNCISVYSTTAVVNIYSGTFNGTDCTTSGNHGGTVYNHGILNIYGGTFSDAELIDALGGCLYSDGTLNIADAELKGDVYIAAGETTVSGATKIADLQIANGIKVTLKELADGADITVKADGEFTNANADADAYVANGWVKAAVGNQISVSGNVMSMTAAAAVSRMLSIADLLETIA